ncbi:MAG: heme-binding protein [Acidobacteriota bacterium]
MRFARLALAFLVPIVLLATFKFSRMGYESPEYQVELKDGPFEIRQYPEMLLASTPMLRDTSREDDGFMLLFGYITGANDTGEKIAMTTPVLTTEGDDGDRISFIAPQEMTRDEAPSAEDARIEIETMEAGRFAVYRFSGRWQPGEFGDAKQKLLAWIDQQNLTITGDTLTAGYDPPFTPPFTLFPV